MKEPPLYIAGVGSVGPVAEDPRSIPEMVLEAVEASLADADLDYDSIDAVVTASVDLFDGLTASNMLVTEVVGAVMKPETRIAADGLGAIIHAACQLWAGSYETVLVVGHAKASMASHQELTQWAMDPLYQQPLGVDFQTCSALQASTIAGRDKLALRRWAETAAARRQSTKTGLRPPLNADQVLASPIVASPLRQEMCAPLGDGACAVVLRTKMRSIDSRREIYLTGIGHDLAQHALGDREIGVWEGLHRACARAYAMSGICEPALAFDLAEPSCLYPHEDELFVAASGIGDTTLLSPTGGLYAGYVPVVAGLSRLAEAFSFMNEQKSARRALVHGTWGPAGQGQAVVVLEAN